MKKLAIGCLGVTVLCIITAAPLGDCFVSDLSLAEYEWVRRTAYAAAGVPFPASFSAPIENVSRGEPAVLPAAGHDRPARDAPRRHETLVAPHADELRDRAALAFFGL